jgi:tripartite-type tricarboxylate transporter receptor subunit TctC
MLMSAIGAKPVHVPYRGAGPALNDLVAGQIDFMCDQTVTMLPQTQAGSVRPLAVLSRQRIAPLPAVPTAAEGGVPGFEVEAWNALFAPKGTSKAVVERLHGLVSNAIARPGIRPRFADFGANVPSAAESGPEPLRTHVAAEVKRWSEAIKAAGVSVE